jgi:hypothetical protein
MNFLLVFLCLLASATAVYHLYLSEPENDVDVALLRWAFVFSAPTFVFLGVWLVLDRLDKDPRPFDFAGLAGLVLIYMLRSAATPTWGSRRKDALAQALKQYNHAKVFYLALACAALALLVFRVRG